MDKSVSIVIPTLNRKHTLQLVMDSYLHQKNLKEIIFIDDCSTDTTYEYLQGMIKEHGSIIKVKKHEKSIGVSISRNNGIDMATGDYILFGEDDLYLSDDYTSVLLRCMKETSADIIGGRIIYYRTGETLEETISRCDSYKKNLINYWLMSAFYSKKIEEHKEIPFLHAISLAKAEVCREIKFDEAYFAREETDFYLRACERGYKIVLCPDTYCVHLPRDKGRGGGWKVGILKYQYLATKNNNMLVDRHYKLLKKWGMKGNKLTFKLLHLVNRLRILILYFRFSTIINQPPDAKPLNIS